MADQDLMKYFDFDESDLQANRNNQISDKQKALVLKRDKSRFSLGSLFSSKFGYKLGVVKGPISIDSTQTSYHGSMVWYYLQVGEKSFRVNQDISTVMKQGDVYTIYYCYADDAPDDNGLYKILSVELVSKVK